MKRQEYGLHFVLPCHLQESSSFQVFSSKKKCLQGPEPWRLNPGTWNLEPEP